MKTTLVRAAWAACLVGCAGGTETGNPAVPVTIALGARSSDPSVIAIRSGASGAVVREAWIAFGEPVFLDPGQCGNIEDLRPPGPTLAATDLAAPDADIDLDVPAKTYCGMWVPLQGKTPQGELPAAAPDDLADSSIVVRGERADGTPFLLRHAEQDELEIAAIDGTFDVAALGPALILAFDLADWMRDVDLDAADVNADGEIVIDPPDNSALHAAFDFRLECSLELYLDEDENGALDEDVDTLVGRCADE